VVLVLHAPHPEAGSLLLSKLGKHCKSAEDGVRSKLMKRGAKEQAQGAEKVEK
jgi:hypothetical protein